MGGYDRNEVMAKGVRVYRAGQLVLEAPVPRFQTSDYNADTISQARAVVALLDSQRGQLHP